jgi:hypothetical protein
MHSWHLKLAHINTRPILQQLPTIESYALWMLLLMPVATTTPASLSLTSDSSRSSGGCCCSSGAASVARVDDSSVQLDSLMLALHKQRQKRKWVGCGCPAYFPAPLYCCCLRYQRP